MTQSVTKFSSLTFIEYKRIHLDDSNLVGDVEGIIIRSKTDISLLLTVGSHKGVDLGHVDVIQFLHGSLDLVLVGLKKLTLNHYY